MVALFTVAAAEDDARGVLELTVVHRLAPGKETRLPFRIHLQGPDGKAVRAPGLPFFQDHFVADGAVRLELAPGSYRYSVEKGPEWSRATGQLEIASGKTARRDVELKEIFPMAANGWWAGDVHVHRPLEEAPLLLAAEDIYVAPIITVWNRQNPWAAKPLPEPLLARTASGAFYHALACEDERQGGALLFFNLTKPLSLAGDGPELPSPVQHIAEALEQTGAWVDIEKPFWWDVPAWLATGKVRSIGLANNHMCRAQMYEDEAWGRPRDAGRLPAPRGNGFYSQEIYYHVLNCGFRIPPSAGSASGVLPNPVGYNRVYVHLDGPLTYEGWWQGLAAGRCFVTNGPLLDVRANGRFPGSVLALEEPLAEGIALDVSVHSADELERVEVVQDGAVVESLAGSQLDRDDRGRIRVRPIATSRSGWFLLRAIARVPETFRFASTAPFYVEVAGKPARIRRESVQFFLQWIDERIHRLEASKELKTDAERAAVIEPHRRARMKFEGLLERAE